MPREERGWPKLGIIMGTQREEEPGKAPSSELKSLKVPPDTHLRLLARARMAGMKVPDYLEWLMAQVPVDEEDLRRVFGVTTKKKKGG